MGKMSFSIPISIRKSFTKKDLTFFVPYGIWFFWNVINITNYKVFISSVFSTNIITILVCFLLLFKWLTIGRVQSNRAAFTIAIIILGIVIVQMKRIPFFGTLFIIVSAFDVNFKKIVKFSLLIMLPVIVLTIIGAELGIIENTVFDQGERVRESLGFIYSGLVNIMFMNCVYSLFYLYHDRIKLYHWGILGALMLFFYQKTKTRTDLILFVALFAIWVLVVRKKVSINNFISKSIFTLVYPSIFLLSFVFSIIFDPFDSRWRALNDMFTGRLGLAHNMYEDEGYSLFGKVIIMAAKQYAEENHVKYNYVDNGYLQTAFLYGMIIIICIVLGYTLLSYRAAKEDDSYLALWLFFNAVENFIYPNLIDPKYNLLCMALAMTYVSVFRKEGSFIWKKLWIRRE